LLGYNLTTVPSELAAQAIAGRESVIQSHLNTLKLSSRVRLTTGAGKEEGRLVFRSADSVGVRGEGGEVRLPLSAIDSLWARRARTSTGFLLGLAAGVGSYALFTAVQEDSDDPAADNARGLLVGLAVIGLGTLWGASTGSWQRMYP
jgi:hypothetical protein